MYNKPLILTIIMVVLAGLAAPFIYARMGTGAAGPPRLAPPPGGEKQCVEPKEYMREHHVDLLMRWRDSRVREGSAEICRLGRQGVRDGPHDDVHRLPFEQSRLL